MFRSLAALAASSAVALCLLSSQSALADTLTLTAVGGGSSDGVYVYPYIFTVTEGGQTVTGIDLSCLNFNREVTIGESWTVDTVAVPLGNGTLDGQSDASFRADAWLMNQYSNPAYTATEVQFAIWSIMDPSGVQGKNGFDSSAQSLANLALQMANMLPSSYFANEVIFLPDSSDQAAWTNGEPQIFMDTVNPVAATPEPSSLMLLGTGLAGAASLLRRRKPCRSDVA